jgi:hypothetical protein
MVGFTKAIAAVALSLRPAQTEMASDGPHHMASAISPRDRARQPRAGRHERVEPPASRSRPDRMPNLSGARCAASRAHRRASTARLLNDGFPRSRAVQWRSAPPTGLDRLSQSRKSKLWVVVVVFLLGQVRTGDPGRLMTKIVAPESSRFSSRTGVPG